MCVGLLYVDDILFGVIGSDMSIQVQLDNTVLRHVFIIILGYVSIC